MKTVVSWLKISAFLSLFAASAISADNPQAEKARDDCEVVGINYQDNPELTRAEKLALMEQAFYESLKKFEDCNLSVNSSSSSSGNAAAVNNGSSGAESAASDAMQGTEAETVQDAVAASDTSSELSDEESQSLVVRLTMAKSLKIFLRQKMTTPLLRRSGLQRKQKPTLKSAKSCGMNTVNTKE